MLSLSNNFRSLLAPLSRHWRRYVFGAVALTAVDIIDSVAVPWLQGATFANLARPVGVRYSFALISAALMICIVFQMVLRYAWRHFFLKTADIIGAEVRAEIFTQLQRLPIGYFDTAQTGDLMSRVTNDLNEVRLASGTGMLLMVDSVMYLTFVIPQLIWISPKLALVCSVVIPGVPFLVKRMGGEIHRREQENQRRLGVLTSRVEETISGIRIVKVFGQEQREAERFAALARDYLAGQISLARVQAVFGPGLGLVFELAQFLVLLFGGREVVYGRLSLAQFVVFSRALDKLVWPMMAIGWVTSVLQRGAAARGRIDEVLEQPLDPIYTLPAGTAPVAAGAISIRDLTFRYPSAAAARPPALDGVSAEIPGGALVGIVGPVGSGKSTLLALLARLYPPPRGVLTLDGVDVLDWPITALRDTVTIVPQETFLFAATIAENIAFGRTAMLERAQIEESAEAAHIAGEIRSIPGGFDAVLGERGVNLSGGQRQRVAIARALVRRSRVVLLDDALSAVDVETEAAIAHQLETAHGTPTRIVATHRISAVRGADLILVLNGGRLVEQGRHAELMARGGLYASLAREEVLEEGLKRA